MNIHERAWVCGCVCVCVCVYVEVVGKKYDSPAASVISI